MIRYIIKRLLQLIPILIGITFLSFAMMRLAGGDAVTYMYDNAGASVSQEVIDQTKKEYGLDQPFLVQYAKWFAGMVTGDMGTSYVSKRDVYDTFAGNDFAYGIFGDFDDADCDSAGYYFSGKT